MYTNWLGFYKWILSEPRVPGAPCERETRVSFTYEYFTPSQGSANRSASGRVLGAMTCHGSASFGQSRLYCIVRAAQASPDHGFCGVSARAGW